MTIPNDYTFVGLKSIPNSIKYAPLINQYCTSYKFKGQPLDARYVATLISAEVGPGWNTNSGSSDYATTHSAGLGQFTDSTGPAYGLHNQADKTNPQKTIKAICNYYRDCLKSASAKVGYTNPRGAYEEYNGGPNGENIAQAQRNTSQNWDPAYRIWFNNAPLKKLGSSPKPNLNNNNTNALKDAEKQRQAKIQNAKIATQRIENQLIKQKALKASEELKKAKLTKNPTIIKNAQNNVNVMKKPNINNAPKIKVLKSGMGFIGLVALIVVFKNGYDL